MILVDIGNMSVHIGLEEKGTIVRQRKVATSSLNTNKVKKIINRLPYDTLLICSVVPQVTKYFKSTSKKTFVVGKDIKIPVRCLYNKRQVGQDRLVNAFAARNFFPAVRLVIDFGSAITFDFISPRGDYVGGFISPGISLSYHALSRCALLPHKIKIESKRFSRIPRHTQESINKGVIEGISLMVNAWIKKYIGSAHLKKSSLVVITGGEAKYLLRKLTFPYLYEPDLVLKGLILLKQHYFK